MLCKSKEQVFWTIQCRSHRRPLYKGSVQLLHIKFHRVDICRDAEFWALSVGWISLIRSRDKEASVAVGVPGYSLSFQWQNEKEFKNLPKEGVCCWRSREFCNGYYRKQFRGRQSKLGLKITWIHWSQMRNWEDLEFWKTVGEELSPRQYNKKPCEALFRCNRQQENAEATLEHNVLGIHY